MNAYLVLQDGTVFKGKSFGYEGEAAGEVVFTTSMVGYLETLTDPSYYGQVVVQTFPLIGNYGIIPSDFEGPRIGCAAYVVKEWCAVPSNFRSEGDLDAFLKEHKIVGLCDIDTRALTRIIREKGVMSGSITTNPKAVAVECEICVEAVSADKSYSEGQGKYNVALMDFGVKKSIKQELINRDCKVNVFPAKTSAEELLASNPDGIVLSNGPGDPAVNMEIIAEIKKLKASGVPIFGIGLGHQLMALASGLKTQKLLYGHRGSNQPVKEKETGRVYITNQNHGYIVNCDNPWLVNANDGTCEGIMYDDKTMTVQFDPDADLFDRFVLLLK